MALSTQQFTSTGVEDHALLTFPYLQRQDIHMYVNTVEYPFTWASDSRINFAPAPVGAEVVIKRITTREKLAYQLQEGAPFTRQILDLIHTQLLYLEQEGFEGAISAIYGDVDLHGFRVRNAGDPVAPKDYTTKQWVEHQILSAELGDPSQATSLSAQAREALRRSYAEAGHNLVDGSFEAGGTLVNANDVLLQERTGKAFSGPAGTVSAGTNPASGGFVDVSGELSKYRGYVDLAQFVAFDGSDETAAFAEAVTLANSSGSKLISSKSGTIKLTPSASGINVQCDMDLKNVTIKPAFIETSKSYLFRSTQAIQDITPEVDLTKLTKGAHRLYSISASQPINKVGFVIVESTSIARYRYDNGAWTPVLAKQPLTVGSWYGDLSQKVYFNFAALAGVTVKYKPQTRKLNIQLGDIDLTGSNFYSLFRCERNDVEFGYGELKGFSNANNNALYTPCENFQCNNFTISRSTAHQIGSEANTGYFCLLNQSDNTRIKDVQNAAGWGGVDGNYFSRLTVENSTVYAVSGHAYASDIVVVDSYVYRYGNIQGYGKYILDNVKLVSRGYPEASQNDYFVRVRTDYGSSWDGEIKLINPSVDAKNALSKFEFVFVEGAETSDTYRGFDNNYIPDVLVQNPRFRSDENTSTVTSVWVISMESGESTKDWVRYTYLPRTLTVKEGDIKAANGVRIKSVRNKIGRYDGMLFLTRSKYLNINVSDISADVPLSYASRWSEIDSIYGLEVFPLPKLQDVRQKVVIKNADWHGVYLRTTQNIDITINDSNIVGPYRGNSADVGNVYTLDNDSEFKVNGGRVIKMWDLGSNFSSQVIRTYLRGVTFDWASYFTGVNASVLDPIYHSTFQAQVALIWGCSYAAPRFANDSVSSLLSTHVTKGYSNAVGLTAVQEKLP